MKTPVFLFLFFLFFVPQPEKICKREMRFRNSLYKAISNPPQWMQKQIDQDFAPFQKEGIRSEFIGNLIEARKNDLIVLFKIHAGEVSYNSLGHESDQLFSVRLGIVLDALKKLASHILLPDVEFVVSASDSNTQKDNAKFAPLFVFSKKTHFLGQVLIPDTEALFGYNQFQKDVHSGNRKYPWEKKQPIGFWRGATTGNNYNQPCWRSFARSRLVFLSLQYPSLINARFSSFLQGADLNKEMLEASELKGQFVTPLESLQYKYLIDVDGNTCSWSRLYWTLLSNSVVFKQITDNMQWYYGALVPDYHYIPLKEDLSDLPDKIRWATENDAKMKEIAMNATHFASENLSETMIYLYLYLVINHYAKLLML